MGRNMWSVVGAIKLNGTERSWEKKVAGELDLGEEGAPFRRQDDDEADYPLLRQWRAEDAMHT